MTQFIKENWWFILILGGMITAWVFLRTPATDLASTAAFDQQIQSGTPVVVEFFSNT
ncbi:MAG: hypothetical protein JXD18_01930 [Anaerolineae bacterium]|nr:hypothetical protein [Anaerolineae bacterium]